MKQQTAAQKLTAIEDERAQQAERQRQMQAHQQYDQLAGLLAECAGIVSNGHPRIRACLAAGMQQMLAPYEPAPIPDARDAQLATLQARLAELEEDHA